MKTFRVTSSGLRIFAGLCLWRLPEEEEKKIICGKLVKGVVAFGDLVETGLPDEKQGEPDELIELNGAKYRLVS
jgi:hypothetical protein